MSPEHHAEARMLGTHLWTAIHGQLVLWRSLPGLHHHGETVLIELEQSLLRRLLPRQVTAEHRVPNPPVHPGPVTPAKESGSGCPARTAAALPAVGASDQRSGGPAVRRDIRAHWSNGSERPCTVQELKRLWYGDRAAGEFAHRSLAP